ncbi:hypothetical protein L3Y34_017162 [Caenorhabditis briggsae]|uniref:Uncharacterized protein n=1 Tax=Caenorhabditis briggsae TaxID=6238 RepID=A0AAE9DHT7_CAEBR|nr:hypothetical protein L3Y34_017162 [Caenorhabditis briggsae]
MPGGLGALTSAAALHGGGAGVGFPALVEFYHT